MFLPKTLGSFMLCAFLHHLALSALIGSPPTSHDVADPRFLPYTNEQVLASNKAGVPSTLPLQGQSFCFRPIIPALTPSACTPVIEAIRTLTLSSDQPGAPISKPKHWVATTKSGPIYQWGVPGNPCKVKAVVDPSLGPSVQIRDDFSKEDVERAAKEVVADCIDGKNQAGRRPVGTKGIYVTVGRLGKGEKL
ncbi:MAG: hypothetical protein LQ337_002780 [Flavoplaca oasis]|nr:MAG: hypothetical protein LQ337_002780 [Flavoplaca oasis]